MPHPPANQLPIFQSGPSDYVSDSEAPPSPPPPPRATRCCCWPLFFRRKHYVRNQSNYEVLISNGLQIFGTDTLSLSDPRLKPKRPICLVLFLILLSLGTVLGVFLLVPRGVQVREVEIENDITTRTMSTYSLVANIGIPVSNDNYLPLHVSGNLSMYYYQELAGTSLVLERVIPARSMQKVEVLVNASFVPMKYIHAVLEHCSYFPNQLVFFLRGDLQVKTFLRKRRVGIDTYTFIKCPGFDSQQGLDG